jgi:N6-adenosine-specific RNA methylase IME4
MDLAALRKLPVAELAAEDAVLCMWAVPPIFREAFEVIESWGFTYLTLGFVWVKLTLDGEALLAGRHEGPIPDDVTRMGMGHWTRANAEFCLLGVRGSPKRLNAGVRQVVLEAPGRHSAKPAEVRRRLVKLCGDRPRIELFARERHDGWHVWGNEVQSDVTLELAHWRRAEVSA